MPDGIDELPPEHPDSEFSQAVGKNNDYDPNTWDIARAREEHARFGKTGRSSAMVAMGAIAGVGPAFMAEVFGITEVEFRKIFTVELNNGEAIANSSVLHSMYDKARKGNVKAGIWWLENIAGLKAPEKHEHTGKDGGPIDLSAMNPVERQQRLAHIMAEARARKGLPPKDEA